MPSSRVQTDRTAAALDVSKVNSGRTAPARSTNSATASSTASGGTRHTVSPGTPSGLPAGRQHRDLGAGPEQFDGEVRDAVEDLFAVVEAEEDAPVAQLRRDRAGGTRVRLHRHAERRGDQLGDLGAAADGVELDPPHAVGPAPAAAAATWAASRVLPLPPGPASVTSRPPASRPRTSPASVSRPTNPVSCTGRLFGMASSERSGAGFDELEDPLGAVRSGSRWTPRSCSVTPVRAAATGPRRASGRRRPAHAAVRSGGRRVRWACRRRESALRRCAGRRARRSGSRALRRASRRRPGARHRRTGWYGARGEEFRLGHGPASLPADVGQVADVLARPRLRPSSVWRRSKSC